ncbi:MAG TPA: sigma-E factor negative regulatory protein [Usitatibacter sp.]
MTQEISSLMDGEAPAQEAESAIRSCSASAEHKETWLIYHAIGDAMRGQSPRVLALPDAVIEALKAQPTVLAPRRRAVDSTFARVAFAAAASVATLGVVGWLGTQGGQGGTSPVIAKSSSSIQAVSNNAPAREIVPDARDYLAAHRQMPSAELYRPVNNRAPAPAR